MMHDDPSKNRNGEIKGMKRGLLFVALIMAACGVGGRVVPAQEHKGPRMEIKEERHDFGKVAEGEQVVHVFDIRNAGDEVLDIQKVQTS